MTQQKKQMLMTILPIVVCAAGILFLNNMWQCRYERDSYRGISALCQTILENDPGAEELLPVSYTHLTLPTTERV